MDALRSAGLLCHLILHLNVGLYSVCYGVTTYISVYIHPQGATASEPLAAAICYGPLQLGDKDKTARNDGSTQRSATTATPSVDSWSRYERSSDRKYVTSVPLYLLNEVSVGAAITLSELL